MRGQVPVCRRIPLRIIHSVQNPAQIGSPRLQHALQLLAKLRGLNLLGVFPAHRGQNVGVNNPALQEIEVVELFHLVHCEHVPWKKQLLGGDGRKCSLVGRVMDRQHRARALEHRVVCVQGAQIHRNQRRLPVVHMEYIRHAQQLRCLQHRPAEQAESLRIVRVIARPGSV